MSKRIKGITITLDGESKGLDKALSDVNKRSREVNKELNDVNRLLRFNPSNTELISQKQKLLGDQIEVTSDKLNRLKNAQDEVTKSFERGEISEEQYRAFQREIVETESKLNHFESQLSKMPSKVNEFGKSMEKAGESVKDAGDKMQDIGKTASLKVSAPIIAAGAASVAAFKEVDESLDGLAKNTGATGDELKEFHDIFRNIAKDMPAEISDISQAVGDMNTQFGLTGDELESTTRQMIKFSEISDADVSSSIMGAKQSIEAFNLSADDLDHVLDSVAYTAQNTGSSTDKLFDSVVKGAPQLQAMGLDFAQSTYVMGQFEQKGIDGSKALGYLTRAQTQLAKEGKSLEEGMAELVDQIGNSTSETEQLALASEYFGTKGASVMLEAVQRGALDFSNLSDAAEKTGGTVSATFDETLDPIDNFQVVMNNLKLVGSDVATVLQEVLAPMLERLVEIIQEATDWFKNLSPEAQRMIIIAAGIAAAVGPVLIVLGKLVKSVGSIIGIVGKLMPIIGGISAPVAGVIAAVAALIAIGVALYKNWDTIKEKAVEIWGAISEWFKGFWQGIKDLFSNALDWIDKVTGGKFKSVTDAIRKYINMAKDVIMIAWNYIKNTFGNALEFIKGLVTLDFGRMKNAISNQMENVRTTISNIWNRIMKFFKDIDLKQIGIDIIKGLIGGIGSMAKKAVDSVKGVVNGAIGGAKKLLGIKSPSRVFMNIGEDTGEGLVEGLESMGGRVQKASERMVDAGIPKTGADAPAKGGNSGSLGVGGDIIIESMSVRNDNDIKLIAQELFNLQERKGRGKGVQYAL